MSINDAIEELRRFTPECPDCPDFGPDLTVVSWLAVDADVRRLLRLATRFVASLGSEARDELGRRAGALTRETATGSTYDDARRRAAEEFLMPLHPEWAVDDLYAELGVFSTDELNLGYQAERTCHLLFVQGKVGAAGEVPAAEAGRRFLDELDMLNTRLEDEQFWGSLILDSCLMLREDPASAYACREAMVLQLRPFIREAYDAVLEAAVDLAAWERERAGPNCAHSPDFRSVRWFGTPYTFSPNQAACVRMLWECWENGTPEVGDATLLEEANVGGNRLVDVFKHHPAWNCMIVTGTTKGSRRLTEPGGA